MATPRYGYELEMQVIEGVERWFLNKETAQRLLNISDVQAGSALEAFGTGVIKDPDADSLKVSAGTGRNIVIGAGRGFSRHSTYGGFWFQLTAPVTFGPLEASTTHYILLGLKLGTDPDTGESLDTRETGFPDFIVSPTDTADGALLIAEVVVGTSTITSVTDRRTYVSLGGGGGSVPTGTGVPKIVSGVQQAAASLISNADVANDAAIAESKLSLASDAAAGTASRRSLGTGATQAAAGNHSHSNATTTVAGFMSGTDKTKLDAATASPSASTLMMRDANGRAQVAAPSADTDIATKKYVDDATTAGAPDADLGTKGITELSVAPVGEPIAVGDNDPRLQAFGASGAGHSSGMVPTPGATEGSSKFLCEDSTWKTPPGGSLSVEQDGEAAVNDVSSIVYDGATVTDNEDGSVTVEITPASVGAAEAVHTHVISDVTGLQTALDGKAASSHNHDDRYYTETEIDSMLEDFEPGGGGIAPRPVAQTGHGLSVGNHIKVTGNNTYAKAKADSAANAEIAGYVTTVDDANNFEYLPVGPIVTGSGWTAGAVRFLDPSTAGADTATPPTGEGEIVKAVLLPINTTEAILLDYVGYAVPAEGGGGGDADTLEGEGGSYYRNRANHTGSQAISTITGLQTALDNGIKETIVVAVSDEVTSLTTGTAKVTFRMPFAMTLTGVRASLATSSSSGNPTFDINENGSSILSTKLSIDSGEKTSTTAATAAVISDANLADDAEITIDIDAAGTGAKGAKITFIGVRA